MKYTFYLLIAISFLVSSCGDNLCNESLDIPTLATFGTYNKDISVIDSYLDNQGLAYDTTDSGLRYVIDTIGLDRLPTLCDAPTVAYVGSRIDDDGATLVEFDSSDEFTFDLSSGLVQGWKEGILLIGLEGTISLYMPSYLGYGVSPPSASGIPINSPLVFKITLSSF